jgi:hypothetical protein
MRDRGESGDLSNALLDILIEGGHHRIQLLAVHRFIVTVVLLPHRVSVLSIPQFQVETHSGKNRICRQVYFSEIVNPAVDDRVCRGIVAQRLGLSRPVFIHLQPVSKKGVSREAGGAGTTF